MNRNTFKRPGLTLVVATTLLFTGPIAAYAAVGEANNATNNAGNTAANSASADGNTGIVGTEPGASTATGGIKINKVTIGGRYGDKFAANTALDIRVDYTGDKVEKGATFSVNIGNDLQVPNGFNSVDLKATALDGAEKTIGKCTAADGAFTCTVTEDIAETLGGNGAIKNGFVRLEATLTKDSVGKTTTDVIVDGTKYTVGLGKGVVGEPVTPGNNKFCYSYGKSPENLYQFYCQIQAQGTPGQTITITENRDDAVWKTGVTTVPTEGGDWANPAANPKADKKGKTLTFVVPDTGVAGTQENRVGVVVTTDQKEMTNTATINGQEVSSTVTWKAKGSSGAETDEDAKPVTPPPAPTPEPDPKPSEPPVTPEPEKPTPEPDPKPSEPPVTPEDPKPAPTPDPTPEPSTPPVNPEPEKPAPTPDPTPEQPTPNPDPKPTPEPSTPSVTPPAPNPEPSKPSEPTDPAPTPDPKPSEPSVTPPAPTPEKPAEKPKPEPSKPAEKPEPKETPKETPSQPSTQTPPAPSTPDKPGNSTNGHKGAVTGLAQTGASDIGLMIAGATALITAGGIAMLLRRRQNNN